MKVENITLIPLLGQLQILMSNSLDAYKNYLLNGKKFVQAKELRKINSETIMLLEENRHNLSTPLQGAAAQLLAHYHIWRNKWDELAATKPHNDEDVFVFENNHTFPKNAAKLFEEAYMNAL